jgi:hypothetical protein
MLFRELWAQITSHAAVLLLQGDIIDDATATRMPCPGRVASEHNAQHYCLLFATAVDSKSRDKHWELNHRRECSRVRSTIAPIQYRFTSEARYPRLFWMELDRFSFYDIAPQSGTSTRRVLSSEVFPQVVDLD